MVDEQIQVEGERFLSRQEEQTRFRQVLRQVLAANEQDGRPAIFLIQGERGIGKSRLLRRMRDIAASESPFETEIHTLLLDWEFERYQASEIHRSQQTIRLETVLSRLHHAARDMGWARHFSNYQSQIRFRLETEEKVGDLLDRKTFLGQYALLQELGTLELAALVRGGMSRNTNLRQILTNSITDILRGGPDRIVSAQEQAVAWIEAVPDLEKEEKEIFRFPNLTLVKGFAEGLNRVASAKPLVLLLDSYELVRRVDPWLRLLIQESGPNILWVIASDQYPGSVAQDSLESVYRAEFSEDLIVFDLNPLQEPHVGPYLRFRSPDRLVTQRDTKAIFQATGGIPLALQLAADLWAGGISLAKIVVDIPENADSETIIETMSRRLLIHCEDQDDRQALILLALQRRPNDIVHQAVLNPGETPFQLDRFMKRLATRYFCIRRTGGITLHRAIAEYIQNHLLKRRIRFSEDLKAVTTRATASIHNYRDRVEFGFARLEDRFGNQDWRGGTLDNIHWLCWHSEFQAWRSFNRDFVAALVYDPDLAACVLDIVSGHQRLFGRDGRTRLKVIQDGFPVVDSADPISKPSMYLEDSANGSSMIAELDQWFARYGGKDLFASERRAVLDLLRGDLIYRSGNYRDAVMIFNQVERNLPVRGEMLVRQLAVSFEKVGHKLAWDRVSGQGVEALPSEDAESALKKAINLGRRNHKNYHALGAVQEKIGKFEAALENLLQAVTLNPDDAIAWFDLGMVYCRQERDEKAIPALRRAIEIEPRMLKARFQLALVYRDMEQEDELEDQLDILQTMVGTSSRYNQARLEALKSQNLLAISHLREAVRSRQIALAQIRLDPVFELLRDLPEFRELIG